jgi:hypothetical protein
LEEEKKEVLKETICVERQDYYREALHKEEVGKLKAKIADLRDKVGDFGCPRAQESVLEEPH